MATTALVAAVLGITIYFPAGQLLMQLAAPIEYVGDNSPFERLDVVLVNHWAFAVVTPRRGDVVLFSPQNLSRARNGEARLHIQEVFEEDWAIDRLIGLPGDRVVCDGGELSVNGAKAPWMPLRPDRLPRRVEITVPRDRYLILPTTSLGARQQAGAPSFWKSASLIPRNDILGGVYMRIDPISRFWFIR
jgi:signal peptidase I